MATGNIDGDGQLDLVVSFERATNGRSGIVWLEGSQAAGARSRTIHELSGPEGIKFDRVQLVDVDRDGDLDVVGCEESEPVNGKRRGLGVVWYENPHGE